MTNTAQHQPDTTPHRLPAQTVATLHQLLTQAQLSFSCDAAAVLCIPGHHAFGLAAGSEPDARRADQLQLSCQEGPGLRTPSETGVWLSGDLSTDQRWPQWGLRVAQLGWQSVLSAPLATPALRVGALNLYARRTAAFDATHAYAAQVFAQYCVTTLLDSIEPLRSRTWSTGRDAGRDARVPAALPVPVPVRPRSAAVRCDSLGSPT